MKYYDTWPHGNILSASLLLGILLICVASSACTTVVHDLVSSAQFQVHVPNCKAAPTLASVGQSVYRGVSWESGSCQLLQ